MSMFRDCGWEMAVSTAMDAVCVSIGSIIAVYELQS
jgi:hypothetical protein